MQGRKGRLLLIQLGGEATKISFVRRRQRLRQRQSDAGKTSCALSEAFSIIVIQHLVYSVCVCACVRVCVRACVRACVCVCVCTPINNTAVCSSL